MNGSYDVMHNGQAVGTVSVQSEGLYYRICCRCSMTDGEIHRLYCGNERIGVLIPENGELTLRTLVAAKRLKGVEDFTLDGCRERFIPIVPGEPFAHLDQLRAGKLAYINGKPFLAM